MYTRRQYLSIGIPASIIVVIMLGMTIGLAIYSLEGKPADHHVDTTDWWKLSVIYQVYPWSFQDSDGDGIGDLRGIINRLDYFETIGIEILWLNPIFATSMFDFGYDITDYYRIFNVFGTMDDFEDLVSEMHDRGMKLVLDFVPNHTSNESSWFNESRYAMETNSSYDDFYVWKNGSFNPTTNTLSPPNNWISVFGGSAWQWDDVRSQYYLHQFLKEQPDLNYRSKGVQTEMRNVMEFWIMKGVDGFRIDAVIYLVEDKEFHDNPINPNASASTNSTDPNYHLHIYNINQKETLDVVTSWVNKTFEPLSKIRDSHIFSVTEGYTDTKHVMAYYNTGIDFPFNFNLVSNLVAPHSFDATTTGLQLTKAIQEWMTNMPDGQWPNWVLGNHDNPRIASRMGGSNYTNIANMILLLLPGTPTCYYGDEIGMTDNKNIPHTQQKDSQGRDPERTPMQWNSTKNAGFSNGSTTWLPVNDNYHSVNVEEQLQNDSSHLGFFRKLLKLRKNSAFLQAHNIKILDLSKQSDAQKVFVFSRFILTDISYIVVVNYEEMDANVAVTVDASSFFPHCNSATIELSTTMNSTLLGQTISLNKVGVKKGQGLVLSVGGNCIDPQRNWFIEKLKGLFVK